MERETPRDDRPSSRHCFCPPKGEESLVPCPSVQGTWGQDAACGAETMGNALRCLSSGSVPTCRTALTSRVGPRCHGERPPCRVQGDKPLPEVPVERLPCRGETLTTTAKRLQEMLDTTKPPQEIPDTDELPTVALPVVPSRVPSPETGKDPSEIKLPPWLGKWGTSPDKDSPTTVPALPPTPPVPAEKPSQSVPQRRCVSHDWQKEIIVDPLDSRPQKDLGSEDVEHGYQGLPIHQFLSSLTDSSPPKDCPSLRALLLGQGQRKATLASMLYEKYRQACTPA
ncbi:WAS/WASL-interacting protein family member 3-like isoform X1 [Poecile atricapillus]|uniref:WAS/WASL-interacting protein family member 3-like isoform X1 n=1 Tax=Poecile atricapillus TaxID=48891 RepID=UPI002739E8E3|nr:WAS/WASL-interacting protein family member 3-like isoform X1 [Poecile atricapillus]